MIKTIKRFLGMKHTVRLIMKSGVTVKVRCKDFRLNTADNEIRSYDFTGIDLGQAMYINIDEIAAIQVDHA